MAGQQRIPTDQSTPINPGFQVEEDFKDTGEYQSDQVHEVLISRHMIPPDSPQQAEDDDDINTGEYQSDQVHQIHSSRH